MIGSQMALYPSETRVCKQAFGWGVFRKRAESMKCWEDNGFKGCGVFQVPQERALPTNAPMQRARMARAFKVRKLDEPAMDKKDEKSIWQIRIRHSDLNRNDPDPFLRYWIKLYDLAGPVRDELHPG